MKKVLSIILAVSFVLALFVGCGETNLKDKAVGKMTIKVNPEFDLYYDAEDNVVHVEDDNEEAGTILEHLKDYDGRALSIVTEELITLIGEAGFLDGVDGAPVPITVTFAPAEGHEEGWEPPTELADDVLDVITACAEENEWLTNIIVKAAEEVLAEGTTVKEEPSEPEVSEPEVSDETSEEESSQEEDPVEEPSKPVETSKPVEQSKPQPKPEKDPEPSKPVVSTPDPEPSEEEDDDWGQGLTDEQLEALKYCSRCGKPKGDGTDGTCKRWLKDTTCPLCGTEVAELECHSCP